MRLVVALLVCWLVGCSPSPKSGEETNANGDQEAAVLASVVRELGGRFPGAMVIDPRSGLGTTEVFRDSIPGSLPAPYSQLWPAFLEANARATRVPEPAAVASVAISTACDEQLEALSGAGYLGPNAFTETFPKSSVLRFSRAAFSPDGRTALIYADIICGYLCGESNLYCLELVGAEWVITSRRRLGVS